MFLKDSAEVLFQLNSEIYNLPISHRMFPNACKMVNTKPLTQKGIKVNPSNYRPISLLLLISRIIEKVVQDQKKKDFLPDKKISCNYQSEFRTNHSIKLCLSFSADKIQKCFDEGLLSGMILTDLQKGFGKINHKILLKNLKLKVFWTNVYDGFSHMVVSEYSLQ